MMAMLSRLLGASAPSKREGMIWGEEIAPLMTAADEDFKKARREVWRFVHVFMVLTLTDSARTSSTPFYKNPYFFYRFYRSPVSPPKSHLHV